MVMFTVRYAMLMPIATIATHTDLQDDAKVDKLIIDTW